MGLGINNDLSSMGIWNQPLIPQVNSTNFNGSRNQNNKIYQKNGPFSNKNIVHLQR